MICKCANPACTVTFQYFRGGRIFRVDPRDRGPSKAFLQVEHFWLCEDCASGMSIVIDRSGNTRLQLLDDARAAKIIGAATIPIVSSI